MGEHNHMGGPGTAPGTSVKFMQINLHHSKSASAVLARRMDTVHTGIALIQEPWLHNRRIAGLGNCGRLIRGGTDSDRACIVIKGLQAEVIQRHCNRDITTALIHYRDQGAVSRKLMVASAYFPYDYRDCPPTEVAALIEECEENGRDLIIGCDANAHHVVWGSSDTNRRGAQLFEFLLTTNMGTLNAGTAPTFRNAIREEVIDITLASKGMWGRIKGWKVSEEISMSDHNYITFEMKGGTTDGKSYRNPRKTNWEGYKEELEHRIGSIPTTYGTAEDIDHCVEILTAIIISAYENNCKECSVQAHKGAPWWNKDLERERKDVRRLFNRSKRTGRQQDREAFKVAQRNYKRNIERTKAEGWKVFCGNMENISHTARLCRILQNPTSQVTGRIRKGAGNWAEDGQEALELLLRAHFPDFTPDTNEESFHLRASGADWKLARLVTDIAKVNWAVGTFQPYKVAGPDGIFPALLQKGLHIIAPTLVKLYRACLAVGYIPSKWRLARVVFLPKPGRPQHSTTGDYRPISLTSFMLKTMERLVDRYVKDVSLSNNPLHRCQHAYQAGKSVDTALTEAVGYIQRGMANRQMVLATLLDIEGAFNHTTRTSISKGMKRQGVPTLITRWVERMLSDRQIIAKWETYEAKGKVGKGCPQGGVLSPTMWCIVVDSLLEILESKGFYAQAYADDIIILIKGENEEALTGLMQTALGVAEAWCRSVSLSVNPDKVNVMLFTNRYKVRPIRGLHLNKTPLNLVEETKFLGVTLDKRLNWKKHIENICGKAISSFWTCRRAFGNTWGLEPNKVRWIYEMIIKPRLAHGAVVWGHQCGLKENMRRLAKVQGAVLRGITGSMKTTPVAAIELLLSIPPLDRVLQAIGQKTFWRIKEELTGRIPDKKPLPGLPLEGMGTDRMKVRYCFEKHFRVVVPERKAWEEGTHELTTHGKVWFTDGSKTETGVGAGAWQQGGLLEVACTLDEYATVFQAEVRAITEAAEIMLGEHCKWTSITFCSDSKAALMALDSNEFKSKEVLRCWNVLERLTKHNTVNLLWVPGHTGIRGNEKADRLAGRGARRIRARICKVGAPACAINEKISKWLEEETKLRWTRANGLRQAKALIGASPPTHWIKGITRLNRGNLRLVVGWLTGHWRVGYHLHKMGKRNEGECRWCGADGETTEHLLCKCPAFAEQRMREWGVALTDAHHIRQIDLASLCRVAHSIDRRLRS